MFIAKPKLSKWLSTTTHLSSLKKQFTNKKISTSKPDKPQLIYLANSENKQLINHLTQLE